MRKQKNRTHAPSENGSSATPPNSGAGVARVRELDPQALLHELRVHQFELEIQNEELRRTRAEMEIALRLYTEIFDFSPIGYATLQGDQEIVNVNLAAGEILERPRALLKGLVFERLVAYQQRGSFSQLIRAARSSGEKQSCRLNLVRGNGTEITTRLGAFPLLRTQPTLLLTIELAHEQNVHVPHHDA